MLLNNIMKNLFLLLIIFGFIGCSKNNHENELHEQLIGNWKTDYFKTYTKETAFIFSFRDNTCSYLLPYGEFSKYWISGDTLLIKERTHRGRRQLVEGKLTYKFLIDSLTAVHMTLKPITAETKELFDSSIKFDTDNIQLTKVKTQYNWKPEYIAYYSTDCGGPCPVMYLEIDSARNIYFIGIMDTEKKGSYSGKVPLQLYNRILSEINSINLDTLKPWYAANWTDDQTCGVLIKTNTKIYESSAYGFSKEPVELRILFHTLMELYKNVDLTEDTTVENKLRYRDFTIDGYPIPPKRE